MLIVVIAAIGCKHKQKAVTATVKKVEKKTDLPKKPAGTEQAWQQKLGLSDKQVHDNRLYAFVNEWYGIPYKYGGCQKSGVDCSCFTYLLYDKVYGKTLLRTANEMFEQCEKISPDEACEGDLFFFKINSTKITHVGVLVKHDLFVHSSSSRGVVVSSIKEAYYQKYFFCAGRLKKI